MAKIANFKPTSQDVYDGIRDEIMRHETQTTYEAIAARIEFNDIKIEQLSEMGLDVMQACTIVSQAYFGLLGLIGTYNVINYVDIFKQLDALLVGLTEETLDTRQLVITFPAKHCFQSIQLLFRESGGYAIVNMRSCNFKVNFLTDVFIGYYCLLMTIAHLGMKFRCTCKQCNVIMNIGSLHVYKSDM